MSKHCFGASRPGPRAMRQDERGRASVWVAALAVLAAVAAIVFVLVTGGATLTDPPGDLDYIRGSTARTRQPSQQLAASMADIVSAQITARDDDYIFKAEVEGLIPQRFQEASLELRWDLRSDDGSTWTISAVLGRRLEASVTSSRGFGAGTVDQTFPVRFRRRAMPYRSGSGRMASRASPTSSNGACQRR